MRRIRYQAVLMVFFMLIPMSSLGGGDAYVANKIVLGSYYKWGSKGTHNVSWSYLQESWVAIDDRYNIHVLDRKGKRVLRFSPEGKLMNEITLKNVDFSDRSAELGDDGYIAYQLEVSSDARFLYVTEGGKENNWAILSNDGTPIKKNIDIKWLKRGCDGRIVSNAGLVVLDSTLKVRNKVSQTYKKYRHKVINSRGNVFYLKSATGRSGKTYIVKGTPGGKQLYRREIKNLGKRYGFIGIDGNDNIYIGIYDSRKVIKANKLGVPVAEINFPDEPYFKGQLRLKVLCDGTILCVPSYSALWQSNRSNWIKGDYAIYMFLKTE